MDDFSSDAHAPERRGKHKLGAWKHKTRLPKRAKSEAWFKTDAQGNRWELRYSRDRKNPKEYLRWILTRNGQLVSDTRIKPHSWDSIVHVKGEIEQPSSPSTMDQLIQENLWLEEIKRINFWDKARGFRK